ncbi:uncharacterized protein N7506_009886 [Penicillium brevicompactum]|uniref:uncharacterized protein n=1 Tax=Penicillium brevicompactum TaxID=5074 RepID=UPI00254124A8|nr:uncharacterized protein N7506_009886 [Penicillium brevicompactum]KAJ5326784.1 hypothetical protein N7506_009886 [Penicillium brevicompactum]
MASSRRLHEKVAIITGASSGLGRAIALRYGLEGAKIVCADLTPTARSQEEAAITTHDLVIQNGGDAIFVATDVGDAVQMENLVKAAVQTYERIDILVNNAGISIEARSPAVLHLTDEATWDTTMRVNVKSVFLGCKYALTQMLSQEPNSSGDRGWIINISSIMGMIGGPENRKSNRDVLVHWADTWFQASYCASKGAVSQLTRQIALDYAPHNIHSNAICPGYTQTAIFKETTSYCTPWDDLNRRHPLKGPGLPDDIAKMAVVLASEDANWVTGICLPIIV